MLHRTSEQVEGEGREGDARDYELRLRAQNSNCTLQYLIPLISNPRGNFHPRNQTNKHANRDPMQYLQYCT